jgi:NAD(P)-dependent dehydrogenase (short-subunit alcohol dehydrogenase family)
LAKGGVLSMSRELGVQFARQGVRVNALCPGPVNTPLLRELFATDLERAARRLAHIPVGRLAEAPRDSQRGAVPGQRRVQLHHGVAVLVDGGITGAYVTPL